MAFLEETFSLKNNRGEMMYGIIHHPSTPNGGLIMMFNIGLHYRVCHSRLFVRQARELQRAGFIVARFDTSKVGYSQGELASGRAIDSFDSIQTGLFQSDARLCVSYLKGKLNPRRIFFWGLCGGALTAIITAAKDKDIDGVIFVAGPVTVTSADFELSHLHPFDANILILGYIKRILNPAAWLRFLSGKTSYRWIFRSLKVKLLSKIPHHKGELANDNETVTGENKGDRFNGVFLESFDIIVKSGRPIFFLIPELDQATYDFERMFAGPILSRYTDFAGYFSIAKVPKANHTFSTAESTLKLFALTGQWLLKGIDLDAKAK